MAKTAGSTPGDLLLRTEEPAVLFLEGWSPGPLSYLIKVLQDVDAPYRILQPTRLQMPPFVGYWWWNRCVMAMLLGLLGIIWLGVRGMARIASHHGGTAITMYSLALLVVMMAWIRLLVCVVVRTSIQQGVDICLEQIKEHNVVAIVGFSWGGAVCAELLVQGHTGGNTTQPGALMIAPATAVVAAMALQPDAALRCEPLQPMIHVVHATHDRIVCPHPERWESIPGVEFTMLQDVHVFREHASKRALADILIQLIHQHTSWNTTSRISQDDVQVPLTMSGETSPQRRAAPVLAEDEPELV